jgi:hypothetical protein
MDNTKLSEISLEFIFFPLRVISWILALPIDLISWMISTVRLKRYNPEKVICPGCGYRGERGSGGKTCRIRFTMTTGLERAHIEHTCFRCGAAFYTNLFLPADKWVVSEPVVKAEQVKQVVAKTAL